jgi:tetratricopeptide (TPR) repeat protein
MMGKRVVVMGVLGGLASAAIAWAAPPEAPKYVGAEPSTPKSMELATRAATAEMNGDPQAALHLADRAIAAEPRDPWPHYDRAMALAQIGEIDRALESFAAAEQRFAANDRWGISVAIYGRAHALSQAGRCDQARQAFDAYASLVREQDPKSAAMAERYGANCRPPTTRAP